MSQKWPQVCEKATSSPRWKTGATKHHVRRVRDAAARAVAVVVPVEIAGPHGLGRVLVEDDLREVAEERHHRAAHHAPARVQDAGEVVVLLADERRHRGALDDRFHVRLGRPQRAADDLARHRVGHQGASVGARVAASSRGARSPGSRGCRRDRPWRAARAGPRSWRRAARRSAGPVTTAPAPSWSRSTHGHVFQPAPAKYTRRREGRPRRGAAPLEGRDA